MATTPQETASERAMVHSLEKLHGCAVQARAMLMLLPSR